VLVRIGDVVLATVLDVELTLDTVDVALLDEVVLELTFVLEVVEVDEVELEVVEVEEVDVEDVVVEELVVLVVVVVVVVVVLVAIEVEVVEDEEDDVVMVVDP
jgi:hypothetical protein